MKYMQTYFPPFDDLGCKNPPLLSISLLSWASVIDSKLQLDAYTASHGWVEFLSMYDQSATTAT